MNLYISVEVLVRELDSKLLLAIIAASRGHEVIVSDNESIIKGLEVKKSIKLAEKLMKGHGRILVRESGTENKIRVMGESENEKLLTKCINIISKKIK